MLRNLTLVRTRGIALSSKQRLQGTSKLVPSLRNVMTTSSGEPLYEFGTKHITKGLGRSNEGLMIKGDGSYVTFEDGRTYLDFTCGIGVTNLGHCHPKVSSAAASQCMNLVHSQCSIALHEPYARLIEKLLPRMPHPSLDSFFFWNSGSEAVEASIKMARLVTGRQNIICMQGGYHGRTYGAMAVTKSKTVYSQGVAPLMPGVFSIPFPFWHQLRAPPTADTATLVAESLYQLELLFAQQSAPQDTAAIIIEPVLGEGGYVPAPAEFLHALRTACDKHGIILIVDEVQSGFGRTGKFFFSEYSGVKPDILLMAKGLANGFPLSGVVSRKELTDQLKPGIMGGTYAGNAVSCAAAVAVIEAFQEENVLDNTEARSRELFTFLKELKSDPSLATYILDIRGAGLMVGVEFASPAGLGANFDPATVPSAPNAVASRVAKKCQEKGMLLLTTSAYEVVRFIPPLNVSHEDMQKGCKIFGEAVRDVIREG